MASGTEKEPSIGMPQLDFSNFDNQAFWLIVFLLAIFSYYIGFIIENLLSTR